MVSVYPATKELTNTLLDIVKKRVPDSEQKGSLDLLALGYKTKLKKLSQDLPEYDMKGDLFLF